MRPSVGGVARSETCHNEPGARRGAALILLLVGLAVAVTIFLAVLKLTYVQQQTLDSQVRETQAAWLAESALERAAAQLAADRAYTGETWKLSAEEMAGRDPAVVVIHVAPDDGNPGVRNVTVEADYPDHPTFRARHKAQTIVRLAKETKP